MKKTCALLALVLLAGCGKDVPPPEQPAAKTPEPVKAPPPKPAPAAKPKAPPLTDAQWTGIKAAFATARGYAKEAEGLKSKGDELVKTGGAAAANDTYVKAKELFHKAVETVSDWTDGDLAGKVTDAQLNDYLGDYTGEVKRWQTSMSELGKIHKDN